MLPHDAHQPRLEWETIQRFDATNAAHVRALKQRCLLAGHTVFALYKRHGWSPFHLAEAASAFACNMSIDRRFPREQLRLEVGGSPYWWTLVHQMEAWWHEGYEQAQTDEQATTSASGDDQG